MNSPLHEVVRSSPELASTTRQKYLRDIDAWCEYAGLGSEQMTAENARRFEQSLLERGLSRRSANRVMVSIRYAARRLAIVSGDHSQDFLADEMAPARGPLTEDEVRKLMAACDGDGGAELRDRAIIVTCLETGLRKVPVASLSLDHLVLKGDTPLAYVLPRGSNFDDERIPVPLTPTLVHVLKQWIEFLATVRITRGPLFRGLIARQGSYFPKLGKLSTSMIQKAVNRRSVDAGIGQISPDTLRATFIDWRMKAGLKPSEYLAEDKPGDATRKATPGWFRALVGA